MEVRILTKSAEKAGELRHLARERLIRQLRRFRHDVRGVTIRFDDVNGPRGGVDKVATAQVHSSDEALSHVSVSASSYEAALVRLSQKLKRLVMASPKIGDKRYNTRRAAQE
ncbi:MAG: hypothetical protein IPJ88_02500 [Myxococcales bacterium]|nr:MAG: hypothetical protein IPJ88_02500 [Myxococcales bacterium]